MCCDEAPPHTEPPQAKFGEKKSVCLFSPFIVMLIIRNWRRGILHHMEFVAVFFHYERAQRVIYLVFFSQDIYEMLDLK